MRNHRTGGRLPGFAVIVPALAGFHPPAMKLGSFSSDGCSLFPDGTLTDRAGWCNCCFAHDISYWRGGTRTERLVADRALRDCVLARTGNETLADLMYRGVRAGGHPAFPTWYRWAYGWTYGRGYAPLKHEEQRQATQKLDEYFEQHPGGYCPAHSQRSSTLSPHAP